MPKPNLKLVISQFEDNYAMFYDMPLLTSAQEFLIDDTHAAARLNNQTQGGVYFEEFAKDIDIGVHFSQKIVEDIETSDPHVQLTNANINAYCVIVEELSHFHLILRRKSEGKPLTQIELEWQAEVDKLLFCAALLYEQHAFAHYQHLFRMLYDQATTISDQNLYDEATKHAARLWSRLVGKDGIANPKESPTLRSIFQETYRASWQEKLQAIDVIIQRS